MNLRKSCFIVFEGIDCSGKTTLIRQIEEDIKKEKELLKYFNNQVLFTFEPGGKDLPYGQSIRDVIFKGEKKLDTFTETCLFLSNRSEHIEKKIKPILDKKGLVICDRFEVSTLVYQSQSKTLDPSLLSDMVDAISKNTKQDLIFFLKIDEETYKERFLTKQKSTDINNYDLIYSNYQKMTEAYNNALKRYKNTKTKVVFLDSSDDLSKNSQKIFNLIRKFILNNENGEANS